MGNISENTRAVNANEAQIKNSDEESWEWIVGYEGFYQVSNFGRIKSVRRDAYHPRTRSNLFRVGGIIKKSFPQWNGYITVCLTRERKQRTFKVHRLVLEAFVGPCPVRHECRHLDGDRTNNRLSNLAWGTSEENQEDKRRHGTDLHTGLIRGLPGEQNMASKLTVLDVKKIRQLFATGLFSKASLARTFGVCARTIRLIVERKYWIHV